MRQTETDDTRFTIDPATVKVDLDLDAIPRTPAPRSRRGGRAYGREKDSFIMRIPVAWACAANLISSRAVRATLPVWFQRGLRKRDRDLTISIQEHAALFGLDRKTLRRGLQDLERGGLITIARGGTRESPRITIVQRMGGQ